MKVYIAGSWDERARLRLHRDALRAAGHTVTSTWLDAPDDMPYAPDGDIAAHAALDLRQIRESDLLVLDTVGESRGGRDFEAGYALAWTVPLVIVGPPTHAFTALPLGASPARNRSVTRWETWAEAIAWINSH